MTDVSILTVPGDVHARATEWSLKRRGVAVDVWLGTDFPSAASASLRISCVDQFVHVRSPSGVNDFRGSVLWRRREAGPVLSREIHPTDLVVGEKEAISFNDSFHYLLDEVCGFAVNSREGSLKAKSKALQLALARRVGMRLPETLITNSPSELRAFVQEHAGNVIIKAFNSPTWKSENAAYFSYSSKVAQELLDRDESIAAVPAIYQSLVRKKYEVRAFFVGRTHLTVRLESQSHARSRNDWRAMSTALLSVTEHQLPAKVVDQCVELMKLLGIVTGSFDFAVTDDDEYVFFEVNQQGQFLWMEDRCPSLPVLQVFCDFLLAGDSDFAWHGVRNEAESLSSYESSGAWAQSVAFEASHHVAFERRPHRE